MKITLPAAITKIIEILNDNNFEAYVVGGCVRDSIMNTIPNDWDITTSATPEKMIEIFKNYKIIETGLKHGTITVIIDSFPVEVTTFRIDGEYKDNRHPENVEYTKNLSEDLSRRDFTINSLAYHPKTGFIDLFGGINDIKNKTIRCVGNADKRFNEDALRIMRAIRFSSTLNFSIEEQTAQSLASNRNLLNNISVERISSELNKLLCGDNVLDVLMKYSDVIFEIIPELKETKSCLQKNIYHIYDVWEHTAVAVSKIYKDKILRLTMLFHDIAKPIVKTQDSDGTTHFKKHAVLGSEMTNRILKRMRYDKKTIRTVTELVFHHDDRQYNHTHKIKNYLSKFGYEFIVMLDKVSRADILAQNPKLNHRLKDCDNYMQMLNDLIKTENCLCLTDLKVRGNDLISLGFDGKTIGQILNELLELTLNDKLENDKTVLINYTLNKYKSND